GRAQFGSPVARPGQNEGNLSQRRKQRWCGEAHPRQRAWEEPGQDRMRRRWPKVSWQTPLPSADPCGSKSIPLLTRRLRLKSALSCALGNSVQEKFNSLERAVPTCRGAAYSPTNTLNSHRFSKFFGRSATLSWAPFGSQTQRMAMGGDAYKATAPWDPISGASGMQRQVGRLTARRLEWPAPCAPFGDERPAAIRPQALTLEIPDAGGA